MAMLHSRGLSPVGVDTNVSSVDEVLDMGLHAECVEATEFIASLPDADLDGVVMFHVVEHMSTAALAKLLEELARVLRPGGLLIIETPNPENLRVGAHTFWLDPTHVRPVPPLLLEMLVANLGFAIVESLRLHPYPEYSDDCGVWRRLSLALRTSALWLSGPRSGRL